MKLGYNDDWQIYDVAGQAAYGGATYARSGTGLEPVSTYGWDYTDRFAWRAGVAGLTPIITINGLFPADTPRAEYSFFYADFAAKVAERYPQALLESWNEPNLQPRFGDLTPKEMGECYKAARTVLGERTFLTPALAPHRGWQRYFKEMNLPHEAPLACHPYPSRNTLDKVGSVREQVAWYTKNHSGPIWVTEVGISTADHTEAGQALWLRRIWKMLDGRERIRAMVVHRLIDPTHWPDASDWEKGCGVLDGDGNPKQAYGELREAA